MKAEAISLELADDGEQGQYAFTCPDCSADVTRPADRKVVALLLAVGVNTHEAPAAAAAEEPTLAPEDQDPAPHAPAFTLDDLNLRLAADGLGACTSCSRTTRGSPRRSPPEPRSRPPARSVPPTQNR